MDFKSVHLRRMQEAVALTAELLPSNEEELGEIRAEYRDGRLCHDRALLERTDREAELRENVHARLASLWMLMNAAQDSRDDALSRATAAEIRETLHQEFSRRNNPKPPLKGGENAR